LVLRVQARSLASNVEQTPAQAVPSDAKKGNQGKWFMSSLDEVYRGNPYSGVNPEEPPRYATVTPPKLKTQDPATRREYNGMNPEQPE